ncbi:hypothetical protein ACFX2K_001768 [Malus domestica]
MLRGGSGGVGGGEDGVAEGALELDGLGDVGVGGANENGLQVSPVPSSFPLYGLCSNSHQAFESPVEGPSGYVVRRERWVGGG